MKQQNAETVKQHNAVFVFVTNVDARQPSR